MAGQPDLIPRTVDQVIFTSIRSPLGEGYRIVAASPGVSRTEHTEITRRSPSHGSLLADDASPGLLSYPLESGRFCVALVRHAGREHTARGGGRVHTHMALLSPGQFLRFACDPFQVATSLIAATGAPQVKPPEQLPVLPLDPSCRVSGLWPGKFDPELRPRLCGLLGALLAGDRMAIVGPPDITRHIRTVFQAVPLARRRSASLSCHVKPAPARQVELLVLPAAHASLINTSLKREVTLFDWEIALTRIPPAHIEWIAFVGEHLVSGKHRRIAELSSRIRDDDWPAVLPRIVNLCRDLETAAGASAEDLARLQEKYRYHRAGTSAERELLREMHTLIEERRRKLDSATHAAADVDAGNSSLFHGDDC